MTTPNSVRFIFIYRGYVLYRDELRRIRFDSWVRRVDPYQSYTCVDLLSYSIYEVRGSDILDYHLYSMRPLTKTDPEYIPQLPMQQNFHSGYIEPTDN
jgi:hypothetical protein